MISYALTTMKLTVSVVDDEAAAVIGATVTARYTSGGTDLDAAGVTWPVELTDVGDGSYEWTHPDSVRLALGESGRYRARITATVSASPDDIVAVADIPVRVAMDSD